MSVPCNELRRLAQLWRNKADSLNEKYREDCPGAVMVVVQAIETFAEEIEDLCAIHEKRNPKPSQPTPRER